ncbi:uncharacterized protein LOC119898008 [Micropterus salmoides]|uniref:uncharacterized protein LOC119898008 n=1 Tax=Micropterus salmoides TaxID=27706 RepID=UPI0018EB07E4|nr:uncharacterized protein LOC119898008 [Micropterus salmoides]
MTPWSPEHDEPDVSPESPVDDVERSSQAADGRSRNGSPVEARGLTAEEIIHPDPAEPCTPLNQTEPIPNNGPRKREHRRRLISTSSSRSSSRSSISVGFWADKKTNSRGRCYQQVACCLGILCVILLLGIIAVCVYENQNLTSQKKQLETQRNYLTEQIRNMKWNEFNISRAQWSIDAYCTKSNPRQCNAFQVGWINSESSCYVIYNADVSGQKTWEEAQEDCRGKISDLVVKFDQTEKVM